MLLEQTTINQTNKNHQKQKNNFRTDEQANKHTVTLYAKRQFPYLISTDSIAFIRIERAHRY